MYEEVFTDIYRIKVPLKGNPLRDLNAYFIRGTEKDLLIDTGFRTEDCYAALNGALEELCSDRSRRDVLITHRHPDHCGMTDLFVGDNCTVYASDIDGRSMTRSEEETQLVRNASHKRYITNGFPADELQDAELSNPASVQGLPPQDEKASMYHYLKDGEVLKVGSHELKVIITPGHTPGNMMLWIEKIGVMFTGDNVLFDITPNITAQLDAENSLGQYIETLKACKAYPVKASLPGHREPGDYHKRIDEILDHHEKRLEETLNIVKEHPGLDAYTITSLMKWRIHAKDWKSFPFMQKWFAVGECMSHLDCLLCRGKVTRTQDEEGIWRYTI